MSTCSFNEFWMDCYFSFFWSISTSLFCFTLKLSLFKASFSISRFSNCLFLSSSALNLVKCWLALTASLWCSIICSLTLWFFSSRSNWKFMGFCWFKLHRFETRGEIVMDWRWMRERSQPPKFSKTVWYCSLFWRSYLILFLWRFCSSPSTKGSGLSLGFLVAVLW